MKQNLIFIVALVLTVSLLGGGLWFGLNWDTDPDSQLAKEQEEESQKEPPKFFDIDKIILSMPDERYLIVDYSLKLTQHDDKTGEMVKQAEPLFRNATMTVLGSKPMDQILGAEFLPQHQDDLHKALTKALEDNGFKLPIDEVLLTRLVVQ